jgi:thiamine pyrophosphate-dependent acetolactate synthase large subunit-like protein/nitrite reductase/ring-hydroxylating ferredoxin subunit
MTSKPVQLTWHKALSKDELPEGRVKTVTLGTQSLCMTHHKGEYAALCNACPHQGGPLGEGSIENGMLRCPWHGWDFDPTTGKPPGGYDDGVPTYAVEVRDDGVYVGIEEDDTHVQDVSDIMVQTMLNWGVKWCFGMVGHSNLFVADALRRAEEANKLSFIGIRHEGAASFAASAYGKLTGKPASCLGIAGPGSTNLLTGLWDAHVDRAPLIALSGQVASQVLGRHNFQEVPLDKAFGSVADYTQTVLPGSNHTELMALACKSAITNRSVSHLVFPDEVAGIPQPDAAPATPEGRLPDRRIAPPADSLKQATEMLKAAKRPTLIVGHGARYNMPTVTALAEALKCPVMTTFKGKGLIADQGDSAAGHHPLGGGVLGRSGTPIASWFMNECDLLLVCGASFSNHTGITPKKPTIQIDDDPMMLAKFHAVDCPVLGSLEATLPLLQEAVAAGHSSIDHADEIAERWAIWREEKQSRLADDRGQGVSSMAIFDSLTRLAPADAVMTVDVGNNAYSFGRYFECKQQAFLMSGYLGSIGFAFPAAMGAWAATQEPDSPYAGRKVISVSGDGGFGQYAMEFTTAVKYGMNLTHILINNANLGKITKEQRAGEWPVWQTDLVNPSFARFAENCGGVGIKVEQPDQLDDAIKAALAVTDGPSLIEIVADQELI